MIREERVLILNVFIKIPKDIILTQYFLLTCKTFFLKDYFIRLLFYIYIYIDIDIDID